MAITRLGLNGFGVQLTGSFAGKAEGVVIDIITPIKRTVFINKDNRLVFVNNDNRTIIIN